MSDRDPFALGGYPADPVATLVDERFRLWADLDQRLKGLSDDAAGDEVGRVSKIMGAIDLEVARTVARTAAGIIAQLRLLDDIREDGEFYAEGEDYEDLLHASIVAGIERLEKLAKAHAVCRDSPTPAAVVAAPDGTIGVLSAIE